jgi:hypothetical protein
MSVGPYHALQIVQHAPGGEQADGISRNQSSKRVPDNADLFDIPAPALYDFQLFLDLETHALAAALDAIVGERSAVALRDEDVDLIRRVLGSKGFGDRRHVVWVSP